MTQHTGLTQQIMSLPVWDTHNHLEGSETLCAQTFWDVGHYFWFLRELQGVGYPWLNDAMALPESERASAYAKAFEIGRNTYWNQAVRGTLRDLWDIEITDGESILRANEVIAETGRRQGWAAEVCERANIKKMAVGRGTDNGIKEIEGRLYVMGSARLPAGPAVDEILAHPDPKAATEAKAREIEADVAAQFALGRRVFRLDPPRDAIVPDLSEGDLTTDDLIEYLVHALFRALDTRRGHVQVFLGMIRSTDGYEPRTKAHPSHALNDTSRIAAMHNIFDRYPGCTFELVNAAQLSNLDIVQAARIYPNVVPGALWWFNFRASTYRECMQYRVEALPATRCTLLATDARCIEWAYCKTLLVKRLLAEFLCGQVESAWLDRDTARYVAKEWLHDAAARIYTRGPS